MKSTDEGVRNVMVTTSSAGQAKEKLQGVSTTDLFRLRRGRKYILEFVVLLGSWGTSAPAAGIPRRVIEIVQKVPGLLFRSCQSDRAYPHEGVAKAAGASEAKPPGAFTNDQLFVEIENPEQDCNPFYYWALGGLPPPPRASPVVHGSSCGMVFSMRGNRAILETALSSRGGRQSGGGEPEAKPPGASNDS